MSGSLLLWLWLLAVAGAVVVWQSRKETTDLLAEYSLIPIAIVPAFLRCPRGWVDSRRLQPALRNFLADR